MGVPAITVDLDEEQIECLHRLRQQIIEAAAAGAPGMALAQIFFGAQEMKAFFVNEDRAREFQRIMGSAVGLTTAARDVP